jgi:Putative peptidoglycan binding domain
LGLSDDHLEEYVEPMNGDPGPVPADPLPPGFVEGDAEDTTDWDAGHAGEPPPKTMGLTSPPHTTLRWLPAAAAAAGLNVVELDGWQTNQQGYYWTDETFHHHSYAGDPVGWAWHHTATTNYVPYVKNSEGKTKANLWMGLLRDGALYATGGGTPTVVVASGGPANFSTGAGRKEVLTDFVARDLRFPGPQRADDTLKYYGNRHYGTTETVHPGDGSPLDDGVWEMQLVVAGLMCEHYGWSPWRHIGHLDHTHRKIDPRYAQGAPYTIGLMQDTLRDRLGVSEMAPMATDTEAPMRTVRFGDGTNEAPDPVVKAAQIMLLHYGFRDIHTKDEEFGADGVFREGTREATEQFQAAAGVPVTGEVDALTWKALESGTPGLNR